MTPPAALAPPLPAAASSRAAGQGRRPVFLGPLGWASGR